MTALLLRSRLVCTLASLAIFGVGIAESQPRPQKISQFSGKPLPRFEALRYSAVHGRLGPTLDHPILWRYERKDLPVMIVRETHGWRRVRDQDGDEVWVQARMLTAKTTALITSETILRREAKAASEGLAALKPGVVTELGDCEAGWCEIKVSRRSGWVKQAHIWGATLETGGL